MQLVQRVSFYVVAGEAVQVSPQAGALVCGEGRRQVERLKVGGLEGGEVFPQYMPRDLHHQKVCPAVRADGVHHVVADEHHRAPLRLDGVAARHDGAAAAEYAQQFQLVMDVEAAVDDVVQKQVEVFDLVVRYHFKAVAVFRVLFHASILAGFCRLVNEKR